MCVVVPGKGILQLVAQAGASRSKARRVETYSVSPPFAGMIRADRIDVSAGTRLKEELVCQSWLALLRSESR